MNRERMTDLTSRKLTRRSALRSAAAGAAALSLGGGLRSSVAAQATPTAPAFPLLLEEGPIKIYDYGIDLPTDDVTLRWADHQGVRVPFHQALHAAFMKAHPNIKIEYDSLGADLAELLAVGVQSGDAHDVLPANAGVLPAQAVREGWIAPLDDVIPHFAEWKAAFPANTFLPGINEFDGKTYACPLFASKLHRKLLYYNVDLLQAAGYDPGATTLTWDTFRAAAKAVKDQGGFGLANAGGPGSNFVLTLSELAGTPGGEFNWKTGDFNYTSPEVLGAIELMRAMNEDGSFLPGMVSMTDTDVRGRMPQGLAAMYISGIWNISIWEQSEPNFKFGVASAPIPNSGVASKISIEPGSGEGYYLYAGSDAKEVAAALFSFVGSLEGAVALKEISKAINPVAHPEADSLVQASENGQKALAINADQLRLRPAPQVRNIAAAQVEMNRRPVTPNLNDLINGIFSGQVDDPAAAMQDLQDRANAEFDRAIKVVTDAGGTVSRADYTFPDWDPTVDYGLEQYQ